MHAANNRAAFMASRLREQTGKVAAEARKLTSKFDGAQREVLAGIDAYAKDGVLKGARRSEAYAAAFRRAREEASSAVRAGADFHGPLTQEAEAERAKAAERLAAFSSPQVQRFKRMKLAYHGAREASDDKYADARGQVREEADLKRVADGIKAINDRIAREEKSRLEASRIAARERLEQERAEAATIADFARLQVQAMAALDRYAEEFVRKGMVKSAAYAAAFKRAKAEIDAAIANPVPHAGPEAAPWFTAPQAGGALGSRAVQDRMESRVGKAEFDEARKAEADEARRQRASEATARKAAADQERMARAAEAAARRTADAHRRAAREILHGYREAFHGVIRGISEMTSGVVQAMRVAWQSAYVAIRAFSTLERTVRGVVRTVSRLAGAVVHVGVRFTSGFLSASIRGVRRLASELTHVLTQLAKIAVHKALQYGKRAALAVGAAEGLVDREGFKSVAESNKSVLSQRDEAATLGMSTQRYQQYVEAAKASGVDEKDVLKAFGQLTEEYHNALENPNGKQAQYLNQLKIATYQKDANGRLRERSSDDVFQDLASKMRTMSADDRYALMSAFFGGREALKITPFLDKVGSGRAFAEGEQREENLGTGITPEDERRAVEYREAMVDLKDAFEGVRMEISRELTPSFVAYAEIIAKLVASYRDDIAPFVASHANALIKNAAWLLKVIDVETGVFAKIEAARNRKSSPQAPIVLRAYLFYLTRLRHTAMNMVRAMEAVGRAVEQAFSDRGLNTIQGWVDAFGRLHDAFDKTLAFVKHWGTEFWNAVVQGNVASASDSMVLQKLGRIRNAVVSYVKQAGMEIRDVWAKARGKEDPKAEQARHEARAAQNGGEDDGQMSTFVGKMAEKVAWVAQQLPGWWETIKKTTQQGIALVKSLWSEFMKVLGEGPGARGTSAVFPFLNKLVHWFDEMHARFDEAVEIFTTVYGWLDKIFAFFHIDFGSTLFALSILKFTGILAILGGTWTLFGGVLKGVLTTLQAVAELSAGGSVMSALAILTGRGVGGAAAGAAAGAAGVAGAAGAAEGAGGGWFAGSSMTGAMGVGLGTGAALTGIGAVAGAGAYEINAAITMQRDDVMRGIKRNADISRERDRAADILTSETDRIRELASADIMGDPTDKADKARRFDWHWAQEASPQAKGINNTIRVDLQVNGEKVGQFDSSEDEKRKIYKALDDRRVNIDVSN